MDEDEDEDNGDIVMLEKKIRTSSMPEQAHKVCVKEIKRLKKKKNASVNARVCSDEKLVRTYGGASLEQKYN